jgi:murein DD-endopeptidase MepM/ murein hydrolase activator NlpD
MIPRSPAAGMVAGVMVLASCAPLPSRSAPVPRGEIVEMAFPLAADSVRFSSGWGDARPGGRRHQGQDLFVPRWTPVLAAADGTVDWIVTGTPRPGRGYAILLRGDDRLVYYYDHLNNDNPGTRDNAGGSRYAYARGLANGDRVQRGDILGYVGDSGNAEPAGPHLHFEIHRGSWGNAFDPEPSLRRALEARKR